MKLLTSLLPALGAAAVLAVVFLPRPSEGQAGADDPLLTPLLTEIVKQQAQITDNQAKIDEKLATIGENLRVARIFVGRGGGKVAAPK